MPPTYITFETRERAFHGVQFLVLSMDAHAREKTTLEVHAPAFPAWFSDWLGEVHLHNLKVATVTCDSEFLDWNAKPFILHEALSRIGDSVVWFDSDLMVKRPFHELTTGGMGPDLVIASQSGTPDPRRSEFFGLRHVRDLPHSINTGVLALKPAHIPLLEKWRHLVSHPDYRAVQEIPHAGRPAYVYSDQDVLEGILTSEWAVEQGISVERYIHWRSHILHTGGIRSRTLLTHALRNTTVFYHGQGIKPWSHERGRERDKDIVLELSPYAALAEKYYPVIDPGRKMEWTAYSTRIGRLCRRLGGNHDMLPLILYFLIRRFLPKRPE